PNSPPRSGRKHPAPPPMAVAPETGPRWSERRRQLAATAVGRVLRVRRCDRVSAPPIPTIEIARPPAAPMPASPQSKPSLAVAVGGLGAAALTGVCEDELGASCLSW